MKQDLHTLKLTANTLRREIIEMIAEAKSGHPGGSLSAVEIITALYFGGVLKHDPQKPDWPERDRFILSKGHAAPVLYAALAEAGYIDKKLLLTLRKMGSPLQGHPDKRKLPVLEASTGSLGQGISIGIGMALAAQMDGKNYHTFVLIGDGESDEGQVWEAALFAGHHQLNNLTVIVDFNGFQLDDATSAILNMEPIKDKWQACKWQVYDVDGHDLSTVRNALQKAKQTSGAPSVIIARTVKGKGISFMENNNKFHGSAPSAEERQLALKELAEARLALMQSETSPL